MATPTQTRPKARKPDPTPSTDDAAIEDAITAAVAAVRVLSRTLCPHSTAAAIVVIPAYGLRPLIIPAGEGNYIPACLTDGSEYSE